VLKLSYPLLEAVHLGYIGCLVGQYIGRGWCRTVEYQATGQQVFHGNLNHA
jgi:hypothetical protein